MPNKNRYIKVITESLKSIQNPAVFYPKNALFSAFLPLFSKKRAFFKVLKSARFFLVKSGALKNARFIRFLPFKRRFLLLGSKQGESKECLPFQVHSFPS
uniref:Uncharacterized protein n=1 Tax=Picea sitchensis TaxID=3332 RepID=A9P0Q3_PICSI|nr:unknown [Picea sitchensis]